MGHCVSLWGTIGRYRALWGTHWAPCRPLSPPRRLPPADYTKVTSTRGRCVLLWGAIGRCVSLWGAVCRYGALCVAMGCHRVLCIAIGCYGALWGTLGPMPPPSPPGGSAPADYTKVISTRGRCVSL